VFAPLIVVPHLMPAPIHVTIVKIHRLRHRLVTRLALVQVNNRLPAIIPRRANDGLVIQPRDHLRKTGSFFEFHYVCPEPVLVRIDRVYATNGSKKEFFRPPMTTAGA
jgi:hypothetical protein